jgi:hypothetical protein
VLLFYSMISSVTFLFSELYITRQCTFITEQILLHAFATCYTQTTSHTNLIRQCTFITEQDNELIHSLFKTNTLTPTTQAHSGFLLIPFKMWPIPDPPNKCVHASLHLHQQDGSTNFLLYLGWHINGKTTGGLWYIH